MKFQLGHFFSEMDRQIPAEGIVLRLKGFNWATSFQKWIVE